MKEQTETQKFLVCREDGRYLGHACWTYDKERALHLSKELAKERIKAGKLALPSYKAKIIPV